MIATIHNVWPWLMLLVIIVIALVAPFFTPPPANLDKLAQAILRANNMQAYWVGGATSWPIPVEGGIIHKIGPDTAQRESTVLQKTIPRNEPMHVPCALMHSESVMDPECVNNNWNGSNKERNPWGADCGACQLKLKDITLGGLVGPAAFPSVEAAQAFAFDVERAIPYFWGVFNSHLITADKLIAGNTRSDIDQRLMNRYILAAILYKQGTTGGTNIFLSGTWPKELNNFYNLLSWWAKALGETSVVA